MTYEPHEYSLIFPDMAPDQFRRLADDIQANGLLHDIVLFEGKILDGRHRYRACAERNVTPRFYEFAGPDPAGFVASENAARRHLTASQLAIAAARLAEVEMARANARRLQGLKQGNSPPSARIRADGETPGKTAKNVAQKFGVGKTTVETGLRVVREGEKEVVKAVESGVMTVNEAVRVVALNPDAQRRIVGIKNKRERSKALSSAVAMSQAAKARMQPRAAPDLPGTPYVRRFLGRLEIWTNEMISEFKVAEPEEMAARFLRELTTDTPQIAAQLGRVGPLMEAIAIVAAALKERKQDAA